jgi:hypothetical protein
MLTYQVDLRKQVLRTAKKLTDRKQRNYKVWFYLLSTLTYVEIPSEFHSVI